MDEREPWLRQPGEPSRWYARFERFRLMGPGRSLLAIYNEEREKARKSATIPASWRDAADKWQWRARAEAWDAAEQERRRAAEEQAYREALDAHRDNALKLSRVALNNAVRLLQKTDQRLAAMNADEIPVKALPAYLRAAAAVAEAALNGEAQALSVDQLLRQLAHGDRGGGGGPAPIREVIVRLHERRSVDD